MATVKEVKTHFEDGSNLALGHKAGLPVLSAIFRLSPGFGHTLRRSAKAIEPRAALENMKVQISRVTIGACWASRLFASPQLIESVLAA